MPVPDRSRGRSNKILSSRISHQSGYPPRSSRHSEPRTQHTCVFRSKMANNVVAAQKVRAHASSAVASLVPRRAPTLKMILLLPDWASYGFRLKSRARESTTAPRDARLPMPRADLPSPIQTHAGHSGGQGVRPLPKWRYGTCLFPFAETWVEKPLARVPTARRLTYDLKQSRRK